MNKVVETSIVSTTLLIYQLFIYLFIFFKPAYRTTICCICKEIVTSVAPEDGRISPKHVELKEHK